MWCVVLLITVAFPLALLSYFNSYGYWKRRGIEGPRPLPFFGNLFEFVVGKKHYGTIYGEIYK